jgi:2-oxoglutarate dehydrogenase E2 component (dihydrolipoamide succinyltransferase)
MKPVLMPQMGESLAEGTIVKWLKAPGDQVARDESLFEISTDKVDTDVPSPVAGILREILVREGETVAVHAPVAMIETVEAHEAAAHAEVPAVTPSSTEVADVSGGHFRAAHAPQLVSFRTEPPPEPPSSRGERSYSPAVLEAARRGGVPLGRLTALAGSGRGGRLTKRDVEAFLRGAREPVVEHPAAAAGDAVPPEFIYRVGPDDQVVPMTPARRRIARHMVWSTRISPHATAFAECDLSRVTAEIDRRRSDFLERIGAPLTYTVLVARAAVAALRDYPVLNSSVVGDQIAIKPRVHLGVAVALTDPDELIVPVVRGADDLTLEGLARAIHDLAARARERRLRPEEVQGGTFTLTNPGIFGGLGGTPILNQPQVAILGLGSVTRRPVVIEDAIAIRPLMMLSLTFDHRAADGMVAFRYLGAVRERLESYGAEPGDRS